MVQLKQDKEAIEKVRNQLKHYKLPMRDVEYTTSFAAEMLQDLICDSENFKTITDCFDNLPDEEQELVYEWFNGWRDDLADNMFNEDRNTQDLFRFIQCLDEEE